MHFSKTYAQLLLSLPPDLRENAIEYRQLKKLINQVVNELNSLGLSPEVLQQVLQQPGKVVQEESRGAAVDVLELKSTPALFPKVLYELGDGDHIEPRLRLWVRSVEPAQDDTPISSLHAAVPFIVTEAHGVGSGPPCVPGPYSDRSDVRSVVTDTRELIIPLVSDTAFFQLLTQTLQSLSTHLLSVRTDFHSNLEALSRNIALTARPASSTSAAFRPHSNATHPATISAPSFSASKSDLYSWREIFQLYVDAEVFESHTERTRGERTIEDTEERLSLFVRRLTEAGLADGHRLRMKESQTALATFLQLNTFILDVKKFQYASTEATRKILKKHAKRTALPLPAHPFAAQGQVDATALAHSQSFLTALGPLSTTSLSLILVQAIGETVLPVVPHIDDYQCVICTSIAFKPIRLRCGHLFCVRCLVKMQKRGKGNCPMCRASTVLSADRSNVDWALLNFMSDWFPVEAKQKLIQNEKEAAREEMEELGFDDRCIIS